MAGGEGTQRARAVIVAKAVLSRLDAGAAGRERIFTFLVEDRGFWGAWEGQCLYGQMRFARSPPDFSPAIPWIAGLFSLRDGDGRVYWTSVDP